MNASATLDAVSPLGNVNTQILDVLISRYTTAAGFVVLLYDFFLTLPDEVSFDYVSDISSCSPLPSFIFWVLLVWPGSIHLPRGFVLRQSIYLYQLIASGKLPSV